MTPADYYGAWGERLVRDLMASMTPEQRKEVEHWRRHIARVWALVGRK